MKTIFISFDYENDKDYRYLLSAFNASPRHGIRFEDATPGEIQSGRVDRVKAVLDRKIDNSSHTLVVIGRAANSFHPDRAQIGTRNWQWWEIERANQCGHSFIAIKIKREFSLPEPLLGLGAKWAHSFNVDAIASAINAN